MATTKLDKILEQKRMAEGLKIPSHIKLNDKQRAFVARYSAHWDAMKAAEEVGYCSKNVKQLLERHPVKQAIIHIQGQIEKEAILEREQMQKELSAVAMLDFIDMLGKGWEVVEDPKDIPPMVRRCMKKVSVEIERNQQGGIVRGPDGQPMRRVTFEALDRLKAIDMLAKMQGLYSDTNVNVKHSVDFDAMFDAAADENVVDGMIKKAVEGEG